MPGTRTCLWFDTQAEEAVTHYVSVFPNSRVTGVTRHGRGGPPAGFTPAISLVVDCDSQDEVDHFWQQLAADPADGRSGWLTDRWGVSWQVVPTELPEMLQHPDPDRRQRVMDALRAMKKLDIARLQDVFDTP